MKLLLLILIAGCTRFTPQVSQTATLVQYRQQLRSGYVVSLVNNCGDTITTTYNQPGRLHKGDTFNIEFDTSNVNKKGIAMRITKIKKS